MATGDILSASVENLCNVAGSLTSGTFTYNEVLAQGTTGATAKYRKDSAGMMGIVELSGSPDNSHTWVGGTSGAVWTPTAVPVAILEYYRIVIEGFTTGATFSLGTTIATFKVVGAIVSKGFDNAGAATTSTRSVYGTTNLLKEAPPANSNATSQYTSGGNLVVEIVCSDEIYLKDNTGAGNSGTAPVLNIAAGFCINSGGASQTSAAASSLACTNNSIMAYGLSSLRFTGCWDGSRKVPHRSWVDGTTLIVEALAFHMHGIAAVKATVTDEHSHTATGTATAMSLSADGWYCYRMSVSLSSMTAADLLTVNIAAYPVVGDTATDSTGVAFGLDLCPWIIGFQPTHVYAYVDPSGGNDTTGVASPTDATARASPCLTWGGAMTKIAAYRNTNYGANNLDGAVIYLLAGTHSSGRGGAAASTTTNIGLEVAVASGVSASNAKITAPSGAGAEKFMPVWTVLRGLYHDAAAAGSAQTFYFALSATSCLSYIDCILESPDNTSNVYHQDWDGPSIYWGTTVTDYAKGLGISGGGNRSILIRDCSITGFGNAGAAAYAMKEARCMFGVHLDGGGNPDSAVWQMSTANNGNVIAAWCAAYHIDGNAWGTISVSTNRFHRIGCLTERTGADPGGVIDFGDQNLTDQIDWFNTDVGERTNFENDIAAALVDKTMIRASFRNCFYWRLTTVGHADDNAQSLTGSRGMNYGINCRNIINQNHALGLEWYYGGIGSATSQTPAWVDDASHQTGDDTGNGDYHAATGSATLNRLAATDIILPVDLDGNTIAVGGEVGAFQTLPAAPTNLAAGTPTTTTIPLTWTDNAFNETSFDVRYYVTAMGVGTATTVSGIAANATSYTLGSGTPLSAGTAYTMQVRATNGAGSSAWSTAATGTTKSMAGGGGIGGSRSGRCGRTGRTGRI